MRETYQGDELYFESRESRAGGSFDASLLHEPVSVLRSRHPLVLSMTSTVTEAIRAMPHRLRRDYGRRHGRQQGEWHLHRA